jgi:hypothetical protein
MINFRFHLVSLIAVFLALGLGILVGSSVVDRVIVDRLDHEITSVRNELKTANAQNSKLQQTQDFVNRVSAYAVDQRLVDVPVALVAERGIDSNAAKQMLTTLQAAGADVPGIIWLTDSWRLDTAKQLGALGDAVGATGNAASVRNNATRVLERRLTTPSTANRKRTDDVLTKLSDAGFIELADGDKTALTRFPNRRARVLLLTGTDSKLNGTDTLSALVQNLTSDGDDTVVGEIYNEHRGVTPIPERGASVTPIRGDNALRQEASTVDDAELAQGQVSAVLALEQIANGTVGHYGYGNGATSPLPTPGK